MRRLLLTIAVVFNLLLLDAVTKELAAGYLRGRPPVDVITGFFNLAYVENRGCAWGMFQGHVWPLAAFALVAAAFVIWKRKSIFPAFPGRKVMSFFSATSEMLLYAGIFGNMIDRVFRGYVIDFFDFHYFDAYHFPCFNFADIYISVSAAAIIILSSLPSAKKTD